MDGWRLGRGGWRSGGVEGGGGAVQLFNARFEQHVVVVVVASSNDYQ